MALSEIDKARVRMYLGYPNVAQGTLMQYGVPSAIQPFYVLEPAMDRILDAALPLVIDILDTLSRLDAQLKSLGPRLQAIELGDLKLRTGRAGESEGDLLRREFRFHQRRLADVLGVWVNGYSVFGEGGPTSSVVPRTIT